MEICILEQCKEVLCVDLGESFQAHIYLKNLASIPPRSSPPKMVARTGRERRRGRLSWAEQPRRQTRDKERTIPYLGLAILIFVYQASISLWNLKKLEKIIQHLPQLNSDKILRSRQFSSFRAKDRSLNSKDYAAGLAPCPAFSRWKSAQKIWKEKRKEKPWIRVQGNRESKKRGCYTDRSLRKPSLKPLALSKFCSGKQRIENERVLHGS